MQSNLATGSDIGLTAIDPATLVVGTQSACGNPASCRDFLCGYIRIVFYGFPLVMVPPQLGHFFHNRVYPAHAPLFDRTWGKRSNRLYSSRLHDPGLDQSLFLCLPIFLALAFKPPCFLIHKNRYYEHNPESGRRQEKLRNGNMHKPVIRITDRISR